MKYSCFSLNEIEREKEIMSHYYIYANNEFTEVTENRIFSSEEEYSFLVEIETTVTDENNNMYIVNDTIVSNEVDVTNISEVLDLAQMFHVDENHKRMSQTFKVELSEK